jgi:preprotein translocase subunit SecA
MRIFEQMWTSVGERTTDLIFRMEQLDEGFVGSTWKESEASRRIGRRDSCPAAAAIEGTETDHKRSPSATASSARPQRPLLRQGRSSRIATCGRSGAA